MYKRIGTSLLLAFTMLVSTTSFEVTTVNAAPACLTISECINVASEARDNLAGIVSQENELNDQIAVLNGEITTLRTEIGNLELSISAAQSQISELQTGITETVELIEETDEEIEDLKDTVAERMTITQRMENRNTVFVLLSESDDLTDFISQLRFFNKVAHADANVMDQLTELLDLYDGLVLELGEQLESYEAIQEAYEAQQADLKSRQATLADLETSLREELYALGIERMSEEEVIAVAEAAREVLERTPPPPVVTSSDVAVSDVSSTAGENDSAPTAAQASPNVAAAPAAAAAVPGTNGGMINPIPGSNVTSEFGPRSFDGFHWGIDIQIFGGRPAILAAASGTVTVNQWSNGYGWYVVISHDINGQRVDTLYAHMESQSPHPVGSVVAQGESIGIQGNTGNSFGAHLHFEVHPGGFSWNGSVNPRNWVNF